MSDIVVAVVQLLKDDGTRYTIRGIEVEEDDITFHSREDRTIQSLKNKINALYFANANRPRSHIRVFARPDAAAAGQSQSWALCNRSASIEAGKLYGFIDLLGLQQPDELVEINISRPIARHLSNKLAKQQKTEQDPADKAMTDIFSNWKVFTTDELFASRKRKMDEGTISSMGPSSCAKVQRVKASGPKPNEKSEEREKVVEMNAVLPKTGLRWYNGHDGDPLYVRQSVEDVVSVVMVDVLKSKTLKHSIVYVISGPAGIGKSWSINAFVIALLEEKLKVFFHSGSDGEAWCITHDSEPRKMAPNQIAGLQGMDIGWIYVYDSPGSKAPKGGMWQAQLVQNRGVSIIFSSPKRSNYEYAYTKTNGFKAILNVPMWIKEEMLKAKESKSETVEACFAIWGGNMRACDAFIAAYDHRGLEAARERAQSELSAQIACIDEIFAQKMARKLEKQAVQTQFNTEALKDAPGHILTPEPMITDPKAKGCFEDFAWRFCSPMAEKQFWKHVKSMNKTVVKELLSSVFEVPSPKGILFEKAAQFLITNGVVNQFRSYRYDDRVQERGISFAECKTVSFEKGALADALKTALVDLKDNRGSAVALDPGDDTSFDAVDMFVLQRKDSGTGTSMMDWVLYLLQDTIARKHSLHPVKVLSYCVLLRKAFGDAFSALPTNSDLLSSCEYVAVVPGKEKTFRFEKSVSTSTWNEIEGVAEILDFQWPSEVTVTKPNWSSINVVVFIAIQNVVARSCRQCVIARSAVKNVVATAAEQNVIAAKPLDLDRAENPRASSVLTPEQP